MSDPIDRLSGFASSFEGEIMPRTAAEARRRGDTLRRRRHALVAAGSAAAVVAVAVPVFAFAGSNDGADRPVAPATSGTSGSTALSADNLLADEETESYDGKTPWTTKETSAGDNARQEAAHPCVAESAGALGAGDVETRDWQPDPSSGTLTKLALDATLHETVARFDDPQAARAAYDEIAAAMPACSPLASVYRDYQFQADSTHDVAIPEDGHAQFFAATYHGVQDPGGGGYTHVLETGLVVAGDRIAVLTFSYAGQDFWPKPMDDMVPVAAQRLVTGTGPGATTAPPTSGTTDSPQADPGVTTTIPDDIPIDLDLVDMGSDGDYQAPEHVPAGDFEPVTLCSTDIWPAEHVDALSAWATGPEYGDRRDLLTFAGVDAAVAAVQSIRDVLAGCTKDGDLDVTTPQADTGYDSVTFATICHPGLCLTLYQVTRVGNAVLMTSIYGEGSADSIPQQLPARTDITKNIATHLCLFTAAGCTASEGNGDSTGGGSYFGPDGYGALRLGMSRADAAATGGATFSGPPHGGCTGFSLRGFPVRKGLTDGYLSSVNGLEVIFARPGMRTPEGIGLGSSSEDVAAAYPDAESSEALATVPLDGAEYVISLREGRVTELALALDGQTCWD
jgi:hypothetical protein